MNIKELFICHYSKIYNYFRLEGRHIKNIRQAKRVLKKLHLIKKESLLANQKYKGKIMNYLKKIDPYVFEELILTAIEKKGVIIKRNLSYSGDGGIDGQFMTSKGLVIIQAKRYDKEIKHSDVKALAKKVEISKACYGLFIHTGTTNTNIKVTCKDFTQNISIISANKLVDLILGDLSASKYVYEKLEYKKLNLQYQKEVSPLNEYLEFDYSDEKDTLY